MYNVKGPSKIVAKTTRRGIQNLDGFRDYTKSKVNAVGEVINDSKPIFQNVSKKTHNDTRTFRHNEVIITPQHEELIFFINDSWNSVYSEINSSENVSLTGKQTCYYKEDPSPQLENFKPFDLEGWWGKRLFNYITNSVNHKG
ncbi:mapk-regulated corepressor-interacting protein 1-like [Onthophagus taurus]|uniref:mapk-regulated corepressor-interacting protein 1-like n=1 Tax=Onthophagus taurus TaxID=166361 RepID=UPI000C202F68|nr:mapk-regulated corepressor-interacting protein 1-like [Onthophagus taurus]